MCFMICTCSVKASYVFHLQRGGDLEKGYYSETGFRKFKDLMSRE